MIFLIFAADTQKCNKGLFLDFSFYSETNLEHQMIIAFGGQVCIPEKSAAVRRKIPSHGCRVIFDSLLRPNEKMAMD